MGPSVRDLTVQYYRQYPIDPAAEHPADGFRGWAASPISVAKDETALIVMHVWNLGLDDKLPWPEADSAIEAQIATSGLAERFRLTGLIDPEQIPAALHASDIVVHCSLREGLARALPQALLAGKPVVSFDVDGAREVVDSETGILLPPKDVAGLQLALDTLASSRALRSQLGSAGRRRCVEQFDHQRMVERIEEVYERVLGG